MTCEPQSTLVQEVDSIQSNETHINIGFETLAEIENQSTKLVS